jgi:MinD-like ATPase involved in chromosome partitioning or flagellar assembly
VSAVEPTVALVFSPEQWVEDLHRHLVHHGGARVRQIVVDPSVALEEVYDALVVSDRWPALTARFVGAVHHEGRRVLGVFDPDEPAGKDHLVALGVDTTIAGDAPMADFVDALNEFGPLAPSIVDAHHDREDASAAATDHGRLLVVSGPRGGGITEVAVGLSAALGRRTRSVVLVDAHVPAPAVAGRLGLGLEPNLRSAVDAFNYGLGDLDRSIVRAPTFAALGIMPGFPGAVAAAQVTATEVVEVALALCTDHRFVVVDADDSSATARALLTESTDIVAVAGASPIGVVRMLAWVAGLGDAVRTTPIHVVVNRAPGARYRREEIRTEITRTFAPASLTWVPNDRAVDDAAWDGALSGRGPFRHAMTELAGWFAPEPARRGRARRARRARRERSGG